MPAYDATSISRLLERLDYEIWLLDFLAKTEDIFEGGSDPKTITMTNNVPTAGIQVGITAHMGAECAVGIMDAITPLVFAASYKVLDMIHEWIIEESGEAVPWRFSEKLTLIAKTNLEYPPLFTANDYLRNYSYAFYKSLLPYRDEIVHRHSVSVNAGTLNVVDSKSGSQLILDRKQLGYLVRFVVALAECLCGKRDFDQNLDRLFKYHLDQLDSVHRLATLDQKLPLQINVELTVPKQGDVLPANLKLVREKVLRVHPDVDVQFNLTVLAVEGDTLVAKWYFPADEVPRVDVENFTLESHTRYRQLVSG
jgi:hypothetical protein